MTADVGHAPEGMPIPQDSLAPEIVQVRSVPVGRTTEETEVYLIRLSILLRDVVLQPSSLRHFLKDRFAGTIFRLPYPLVLHPDSSIVEQGDVAGGVTGGGLTVSVYLHIPNVPLAPIENSGQEAIDDGPPAYLAQILSPS